MATVVVSAPVYDVLGSLRFTRLDSSTELDNGQRRVTRTATLDGGATVFDGGFSHADRVLTVAVSPFSEAQLTQVKRLFQTYPTLTVTCREGGYQCAPEQYSVSSTTMTMRFLIIKDLTEY